MNKIENITNSILPEDIEKLWQAIDKGNEWAEIVMIGIYTGFRVRELLEIKKENVNLETRIIIGGGNKTLTSKDRHVPIHKAILPLIEKRMHNEKPFTFAGQSLFNQRHDSLMNWNVTVFTGFCFFTAYHNSRFKIDVSLLDFK